MPERCRSSAGVCMVVCILYFFLSTMGSISQAQHQARKEAQRHQNTTSDEDLGFNQSLVYMVDNQTISYEDPMYKGLTELSQQLYEGEWNVEMNENSSIHLKNDHGKLKIILYDHTLLYANPKYKWPKHLPILRVYLYDGQYRDGDVYMFVMNNSYYDPEQRIYEIQNQTVNTSHLYKFENQGLSECNFDTMIDLSDVIIPNESNDTYNISTSGKAKITIESKDCGIYLDSVLKSNQDVLETQCMYYAVMLTFIGVANIYAIARMIRNTFDSLTDASKISLLSIVMITTWDAFYCLSHLYLALNNEIWFHFFIMPTFWYFMLFSVFEFRLMNLIWRARYINEFTTEVELRRGYASFQCKIYIVLILCISQLFQYVFYNSFLLIASLYMVPQIIHNAIRGGRQEFDFSSVLCLFGVRNLIIIYFRGFSGNFLELEPSYSFCVLLVILIVGQMMVLKYQSIRGSKFFVPQRFRPQQYNYFVDAPESGDLEDSQQVDPCNICMCALSEDPGVNAQSDPHLEHIVSQARRGNHTKIMKTPCNHQFHAACLAQWMNIKLECPTCRAALPAID